MIFFKKVLLILYISQNYAFLSPSNVKLLQSILSTYKITEISLKIPNSFFLENWVDVIFKKTEVTFNIFSNSETLVFYFPKEVFVISTIEKLNFIDRLNIYNSIINVIIFPSESIFKFPKKNVYGFSNTLIFLNESVYKYHMASDKFLRLNSIDEVLATDYFQYPEFSWPFLKIKEKSNAGGWFPLVVIQSDKHHMSGVFGHLLYTYLNYINSRIRSKLKGNELENRHVEGVQFGYNNFVKGRGHPFYGTKLCLMLPIVDEILTQDYLRKAFSNFLWILLVIFIFYMTSILRTCIHIDFFDCFFESLTISCGSVYKGFNNNNSRKRLIYIQLFLYGFIVWNLYSAKMSSYLSTVNRGKRIESLEDIKKETFMLWASFDVYISDSAVKNTHPSLYFYKEHLRPGQVDFSIKRNIFDQHMFSFNNSLGYFVNDHVWPYISMYQSLLIRKVFSFSNMCPLVGRLYPLSLTPLVRMVDTINLFYMHILESGLDLFWQQTSYFDMKFQILRKIETNYIVLGFQYFKIAWIIGFTGLVLSLIAFMMEFITSNFKYKFFCN